MDDHTRNWFDGHLERVMPRLPRRVHELLEEVPLYVDDYPSADIMARIGVRHRNQLCGLYTGIPLTQRSVEFSGFPSDVIHLFREGVLAMSRNATGRIDTGELERQIRITILHELGHHHGMTEEELNQLGY